MRLALDPRARRLLRRVPRTTVYTALELALLSLLALQSARLIWAIVTPVDPVGDWRTAESLRRLPPTSGALGFDPFFRLSGGGTAIVTSLNLQLFGVREDRASGRGSAIIAIPDGTQHSFAVGDEIMPGVRLVAVGFDSVTIDRGGTAEQLFLDQSQPAEMVAPGRPQVGAGQPEGVIPMPALPPPPPPPQGTATPTPAPNPVNLSGQVRYQPRLDNGRVSGVTVNPSGSGDAFRAAGLRPGDVIVAVNGQRVTSADQARSLAGRIRGNSVAVEVERGGETVSLQLRAPQ